MTSRVEIVCACGRRHSVDATPDATVGDSAGISQRTSEETLGIPRRMFLESLPAFEAHGGEVLHLGRLRLVDRRAYLEWLRNRSASTAATSSGVDKLAADLGLRVVG